MSRTDPQMKLRLPIDLKELVETHATLNGRSMNAEIVSRLKFSFSGALNDPDVVKAIQVYNNRIESKQRELSQEGDGN